MRRVRQEDSNDCAIASLLSIIKYYGGNNTYSNLRYMMKCDKNGVSAYDLIKTSKELGFEAYGIKCDLDNLINNINFPCIAHTIIENKYFHYLVIERITKNKVIVNDSRGIKKYSFEEFSKIWTNVIILLKPIRKLDSIKDNNNIKFYLSIIFKYKKQIFIVNIVSLLSIIFAILNTYYLKLLMESNNINKIYYAFILLILFKCVFEFFKNKIVIYVDKNIDALLTSKIYSRLLSLPYYYFNSRQSGDIVSRINDTKHIKDLLFKLPFLILLNLILLLFSIIILVNININLFLILLVFITIYLFIYKMFGNKNKNYIKEIHELNSICNSNMTESIDGINTIKNFNVENYKKIEFNNLYNRLLDEKYKFNISYNRENLLKELLLLISINTILYVGMNYVNSNVILIGDLILFNSVLLFFIESLRSIFELEDDIKIGVNSIRRVNEILNCSHEIGLYNSNVINNISIRNLNYSYKNDEYVLKNINIDIRSSEKIAVIGSSGIGKSTLFKLIIKQHEVSDDVIYINDVDINKWNEYSLRENICYISQDEKIFMGSILDNIVLDRNVSEDEINKVCNITCFYEVLKNKRLNLNSYIEENGNDFSLGERQRLILSRCLLRNSNILILDEALNGVDILLEKIIIENILNEYKNKTIIYITQRLDNINYFERIIDFNKLRKEEHEILK